LLAELRRRALPCVRWNLDRFPVASTLTFSASENGFAAEIVTDGRRVNLDDVGSIWCRGFRPSGLPEHLGDTERKFAQAEAQRAIDALMTTTTALWINHPQCHARANSKPAQLFTAMLVGLQVPPTLISNDPQQVREFIDNTGGDTIYKAHSQTMDLDPGKALFTGLIAERELANLDLIQVSPGIFQKFIPKSYEVRVTVVGDRTFSGKIDSQANTETRIDWRHKPFDIDEHPIQLPFEIEAKIHAVMKAFELVYGAFDFIVTPEGRYVFLEVNPAGQYMWVEAATGLPITAALADMLADPCRS
jgi:glutathione synthase/RimK-type ligase-like ATP-grasp enzyme